MSHNNDYREWEDRDSRKARSSTNKKKKNSSKNWMEQYGKDNDDYDYENREKFRGR